MMMVWVGVLVVVLLIGDYDDGGHDCGGDGDFCDDDVDDAD